MTAKPEVPHQGGSYVRKPDGSLDRKEFTRQPGEPEPKTATTDAAEETPPATTRKRR